MNDSSKLIIASRLLLLLLAAGAVVVAFLLGRGQDRAASNSQERYVCPMHPEVTSGAPEQCPICSMALERVAGTPVGGALSYSVPELEGTPKYKLIANPKRRVYAQEVRAPAWVQADGLVAAVLYKDELSGLLPGERPRFFRAAAPAVGVDVQRAATPPREWDASTSLVHFRAPRLRPGEVGWVALAAKPRELLVVPSSAVLYASQGPYVLDGQTLTRRPVELGRTIRGFAVVLAGLRDQDRVVAGNAFFLDAERRMGQ